MDLRAFLHGVKLVHVKRGDSRRLRTSKKDRHARRRRVRPVARADIVGRAGVEPAGGRKDAICGPDADARHLPTEDEWLIEGIRETSTGT